MPLEGADNREKSSVYGRGEQSTRGGDDAKSGTTLSMKSYQQPYTTVQKLT